MNQEAELRWDALYAYVQENGPSCPSFACDHEHCATVRELRRVAEGESATVEFLRETWPRAVAVIEASVRERNMIEASVRGNMLVAQVLRDLGKQVVTALDAVENAVGLTAAEMLERTKLEAAYRRAV